MFKFDQRADFLAGQSKTLAQGAVALLERYHLASNFIQPLLAAFDLARSSALTDEPAPVNLGVEMAVGVIAAHKTFTCHRRAVRAQLFDGIALDVMPQQQINKSAGSRVIGSHFASQRAGFSADVDPEVCRRMASLSSRATPCKSIFVAALSVEAHGSIIMLPAEPVWRSGYTPASPRRHPAILYPGY